jgi:WD40 repeat protein
MRVVSGSGDKTVRIWDASTGAELNVLTGHTDSVNSVAISTGRHADCVWLNDKTVRLWDASTGAELNVLRGHTFQVNSVAISKDGMKIVSGSYDNTVRLWDASTGAELNVLRGHTDSSLLSCDFEGWYEDCVWLMVTRLCGYGTRRRAQS